MRTGRLVAIVVLSGATSFAQTRIDLRSQGKTVDFSGATFTRPIKTGTALPAACDAGDLFFRTNATPGQNLYGCAATNTWMVMSGTLSTAGSSSGQLLSVDGSGNAVWRNFVGGVSGALQSTTGPAEYSMDVDTAVIPRKAAGETIGGLWEFDQGLILKPQSSPAVPANGRIWYDSALQKFRCQQNGVTIDCAGSDEYARKSQNLSDLTNPGAARANLGLGGAATLNVGTAAGTVAAGDHAHSGYATLGGNGRVPAAQLGSGTADNSVFLRGDGSWATTPAAVSAGTGLNLVGSVLSLNTALAMDLGSSQSFTGPKVAAPLGSEVAFAWAPQGAAPSNSVTSGSTYFSSATNDPHWYSGSMWRRAMSNPFSARGQLLMSADSSGTPAALGTGAMNQVLLGQGMGSPPVWGNVLCANIAGAACADLTTAYSAFQDMQSASWRPPEVTFALLPSASSAAGRVYVVTDASTAGSCVAGGGGARSLCRSTGSAWEPLSGGGGTSVTEIIACEFDGGGGVITASVPRCRLSVNYAGTINKVRVLEISDTPVSGSITIQVGKSTYASFPTFTEISASKSENSALTGWTTTFSAGDVFEMFVTGTPATVKRVVVELFVTRS